MIIKRISWDEECELDLLSGKGFIVKQRAFLKNRKAKMDKGNDNEKSDREKDKKKKAPDGIHSYRFGSDWGDDNAFEERYSCKCGHIKGEIYEGETCHKCGHVVKFVDINLSITGWIPFYKYKIIQPLYFDQLSRALTASTFIEIVGIEKRIDNDGNINIEMQKPSDNPYYALGMIGFYERFDEIMAYFYKKIKKPEKRKLILDIVSNKDKVFSSYIPVMTSFLRPISFGEDVQYVTKLDKPYNTLVSQSLVIRNKIKDKKETFDARKENEENQIDIILYSVQKKLNELWEMIFELIDGKHGHIKEDILGGRINYTSRNVIIPNPELKADEVIFNYHTFAELFKNQIIHAIVDIQGVSYNEAFEQWSQGITFDNSLLEIMKFIIKRDKPRVFVNRNPTINYGSFNVMRVKDVTGDLDNYTLSLPIQVLAEFNADFDGDVLNIGLFVSRDIAKEYERVFNPRLNMYVDRNDGMFNDNMGLHKDQMIGLSRFCNL